MTNPLTEELELQCKARSQSKVEKLEKELTKIKEGMEAKPEVSFEEDKLKKKIIEEKNKSTPEVWIEELLKKAGQIKAVTHAPKYTHSDNKSVPITVKCGFDRDVLCTKGLSQITYDFVGNAAALDVAKFLETAVDGNSLLKELENGHMNSIKCFSKTDEQYEKWIEGFSVVFESGPLACHPRSKQIYIRSGKDYRLITPVFPTSLFQKIFDTITSWRYGEQYEETRKAFQNKKSHPHKLMRFRGVHLQQHGGSKPQNISKLNSNRGRVFLLNNQPPVFKEVIKPLLNISSIFLTYDFKILKKRVFYYREFMEQNLYRDSNQWIRQRSHDHLKDIIHTVIDIGLRYRSLPPGWAQSPSCNLPDYEKQWLDPNGDHGNQPWVEELSKKFSIWLNQELSKSKVFTLSQDEYQVWSKEMKKAVDSFSEVLEAIH